MTHRAPTRSPNRRRLLATSLVFATSALLAQGAWAQAFPSKPITFVVPFAAGSATDQIARAIGQSVTEQTKQAVKVLVPFHAQPQSRQALWRELSRIAQTGCTVALNWTISTARRERLWAEPNPPSGFICVWLDSVARAHEAFEPTSDLRRVIDAHVSDGVAYLIDELPIR